MATRDWAALPKSELGQVRMWAAALAEVKPPVVEALKRLAARLHVSYSTARAKYYAWLAADRDAWSLVNGAVLREVPTALNPEFRLEWHRRFCQANRSAKAAYARLMQDLAGGVAIPGLPVGWDRTQLPRGWSYPNLMRHQPPPVVAKTLRIGPAAAYKSRPMLYTTREGLWCGSHYLFDDQWHDLMVNVQDTQHTGRPLEFNCIDLFSGFKVGWGFKIRTKDEVTGQMKGLTEQMMRWLVAYVLGVCGYDARRGTVLVVEGGTAAIRAALEAMIHQLTGGMVKVHTGGMQGAPAYVGAYAGPGRGNPRHKSPIESMHNLFRGAVAHLPGQTGLSVEARPEQLTGLLKENDELLEIAEVLRQVRPDLVDRLRMPLLNHVQFGELLVEIYAQIHRSTHHRLEGWAKQVTPAADGLTMRRLSREEVWTAGRGHLTRLDHSAISVLVWDENEAKPRTVRSRMIEIWTKELSTDVLRFNARELVEGETYLCLVSPIQADVLYAYDARGALKAVCPLIPKVCRTDLEGLQEQFGRISKEHAEDRRAVALVGAEMIRRRVEDMRANQALLKEAGLSGKAKPEVRRLAETAARAGRAMADSLEAETISRAATREPAVPDETLDVRSLDTVPEVDLAAELVDARDR